MCKKLFWMKLNTLIQHLNQKLEKYIQLIINFSNLIHLEESKENININIWKLKKVHYSISKNNGKDNDFKINVKSEEENNENKEYIINKDKSDFINSIISELNENDKDNVGREEKIINKQKIIKEEI